MGDRTHNFLVWGICQLPLSHARFKIMKFERGRKMEDQVN